MVQNSDNSRRGICARTEPFDDAGSGQVGSGVGEAARWKASPRPPAPQRPAPGAAAAVAAADRWADEQMFEEDVRAVLSMMRPNRRERLLGWSEYRTGGAHFRATVSWDEHFELSDGGTGPRTRVPNMADVIEAILVGSAVHDDDMPAAEEFELYRSILRDVYRRLDDLQACYE